MTKYELGLEGIEGILPGYYNPCKMKKLIIPATVKIANINLWKEYSYIPNELEELYISDGVEEVTCDLYGAPLKQIFIPKSIKRLHFDQWNFDMIYLDENNPNMFFKDGYLFVQSDDPKSDYKYDIVWHHPQASDEINIDYNVKIKTDGFKKVKIQEGVEKVFFSSCDKVIDYLSIPASIKDINTKQNPYDKDHALWIKQIELSPNNKDYQIDNNYLVKKPKPLNPNNYYYIDNSEPNIIAYTPKIDYTTSLFSPIPADYFTVLFFNHVTINYNFIINWEATNRSKYYVERKRPSHPDGSGGYFQELDKEKWSELCKILANKYIEYKLQSDNEFNKLNQSDLLKLILKNISSLYVEKNVTTIKKGYFDYNPKLVKVVFANKSSLKYLDSNAFLGTPWFEEKKQE